MTSHPVPMPEAEDLPALAMTALVHELARAYLDRDNRRVAALDERIRTFTGPGSTGAQANHSDQEDMAAYLAVHSAEQMLQDWLAHEASKTPMPEVLVDARRLSGNYAPPALRDVLRNTFDKIITGQAQLYVLRHDGLPGYAGAHLYAAATAAAIDLMHPMVHNHARLVLEGRIRISQTVAQGMPGAEAAGYVSEHEAAALLTELLPWTAEMTGDEHAVTKRDLRALIQLYLLDHPVPTDEQKAELKSRIGRRLDALTTALTEWVQRPAAPASGPTPEQLAARRGAERVRRRERRNKPNR